MSDLIIARDMLITVAAFVVALVIIVWANTRRCVRGHYETVKVPARTHITPMWVGKSVIMLPRSVPEHDEQRWVCDEYEEPAK
jgi:hypothetical protein